MNPFVYLLAPLVLMVPAPAAVDSAQQPDAPAQQEPRPQGPMSVPEPFDGDPWASMARGFLAPGQAQVRIEQTLTIRVSPRSQTNRPIMLADLPQNGMPARLTERRMGRCVAMSGIAGMQYGGDRKLILFLRDHRIVSATLEKACRARDFYSGFYVARNGDGMICQDRDQLQSRSGANCRIDGFRQLVETDD